MPPVKRIYIAGPMSGIPLMNFPAFNAEAARLRELGYAVENPAEVQLPDGATWSDYMRADLPLLLTCDTVALLPGWTHSRGARLEAHVARELGLHLVPVEAVKARAA